MSLNNSSLSTHDLTRRSTRISHICHTFARSFNSRPHKEVDWIGKTISMTQSSFQLTTSQGGRLNSIPPPVTALSFQLTTSQGGRHAAAGLKQAAEVFQLTTSQGGRQESGWRKWKKRSFQLTTSQGGRRVISVCPSCLFQSFNSRPHKEVDLEHNPFSFDRRSFNSRPHKEVDEMPWFCIVISISFQLTTSQGGRPNTYPSDFIAVIFQLTTSQGGRREGGVQPGSDFSFQLTTSQGGRHCRHCRGRQD